MLWGNAFTVAFCGNPQGMTAHQIEMFADLPQVSGWPEAENHEGFLIGTKDIPNGHGGDPSLPWKVVVPRC